jgi:transposase-like protein
MTRPTSTSDNGSPVPRQQSEDSRKTGTTYAETKKGNSLLTKQSQQSTYHQIRQSLAKSNPIDKKLGVQRKEESVTFSATFSESKKLDDDQS